MAGNGLCIQDLSFRYLSFGNAEERPVLQSLKYSLEASTSGVILGAADSGKTTLARIIAGLIPRFMGGELSGRVGFGASDILGLKPFDLTGRIGMVFQNSDEQLITTRCDAEAAFALESLGVPRGAMREKVDAALEFMGLSDMRDRNPATLSGGEKKRLLIACLSAIDPELWILDEAFEELDEFWKSRLLERVQGRGKTAVFFDSRWWPQYDSMGKELSILSGGRISISMEAPGSPARSQALAREGFVIASGMSFKKGELCDGGAFLEAEGVSFRFPGSVDFSLYVQGLTLEKGIVYSMVGRNGSGKSTLGKILCGLIPPQSGDLWIHDRGERRRAEAAELNRRVGYMFQSPDYQIFLPTVYEELALGMKSAGFKGKEADERIEEAIRIFRLPAADALPALMSYGARKRLQAATYYLLGREFLILDEMDAGLSYRDFFAMINALARAETGLLLVTQDMALARAVSNRILVMEGGRIKRELECGDFQVLDAVSGDEG